MPLTIQHAHAWDVTSEEAVALQRQLAPLVLEEPLLYVSVGHRVTLAEAIDITLACTTRYRLPESTRQAHLLSNQKSSIERNKLPMPDFPSRKEI